MKKKNNKGMTPFHLSLLYFIQQNFFSFIWFYCFFFSICCTVCMCLHVFACVWKRSFSSSYFFYLVLLFVFFLIIFFFVFFYFLLFCFVFFVLFLFNFRFVMYFFHLIDSFVLSTFQCPPGSHFSLSSVYLVNRPVFEI